MKMLTLKNVAELTQVSSRTVRNLVAAGRIPRPIRVGRGLRWRERDIADWFAAGCPVASKMRRALRDFGRTDE